MVIGKRHIEQCVAIRRAMVAVTGESERSDPVLKRTRAVDF
jgi:hypothetical protein